MKKILLFCTLVFIAFVSGAQQAQSITNVIADTVTSYLSPFGGGGRSGEQLLVLHFKAPTAALNDWAVDRFTEVFKQRGTAAVERRNRPDFLTSAGIQTDADLNDAEAAALGNRAGVRTVITGAFSPRGANWALDIRAVSTADKKAIWSKNYLIQPGDTFTQLAAQAPVEPAPVPVSAAEVPEPASSAQGPAAEDPAAGTLAKKEDLMTETGQSAAIRNYHDFVDKNFPNISIGDPQVQNTGGSKPFRVVYRWSHTDKISVVRTAAEFFQALADANQGEPYESAFRYYQAAYANTAREITFKGFSAPRRLLKLEYQWDLEFTLFDKEGNSIEVQRKTLARRMPFGKGTDGGTVNFYLTAEAYAMMDTLRLTSIIMR
jgi:hypothetical protein